MRTSVDVRFERGDPVREYWLAHGEGFAVETRSGRVVGEVVDVVVEPGEQRVLSLVVQRSLGVAEVPAAEIEAVVPARDAFVLDGAVAPEGPGGGQPRAPRLRPALVAVRGTLAPPAARSAAATAVTARSAGRILAAAAGQAGRRAGATLADFLVWSARVDRRAAVAVGVLVALGRARLEEQLERRRR